MRPLDGVRVLEIGQYVAGPYCSLVLADLGAEVFKIERPEEGDPRRAYEPALADDSDRVSGSFVINNRNKKSVTLDLALPEAREAFLNLARESDVIVENLRPGAMDRLGLSYEVLHEIQPRLIYCAVSGYGRLPEYSGPYSGLPAFDTAIQAMGGVMSVVGEPDGDPCTAPTGFADIYTGAFAALSICAALHARHTTGEGTFIDQSMYDTVVSLMARELMLFDFTAKPPTRGLDAHSPLGTIEVTDGFVAVVVPTDRMWRRCLAAVGREDLLEDSRLRTDGDRARRFKDVIKPELEKAVGHLSRAELVARFAAAGLPAGAVQTVDEIYACEHVAARHLLLEIDDPLGVIRLIRSPVTMSSYETAVPRTSPRLGADNEEALIEVAGLDEDEYTALKEAQTR